MLHLSLHRVPVQQKETAAILFRKRIEGKERDLMLISINYIGSLLIACLLFALPITN
jgi:hypothetical protein